MEFLDTRIYKGSRFSETGILDIETHFKPTNTFQYMHFSSCHPKEAFKGLVRGEAIRILRSNSSQAKFESTISTFRHHLLCRGYPKSFVDPLLASVLYSLRNHYIQPPSIPHLNPHPNPNPNPNPYPKPNPNPYPNPHPNPNPNPNPYPNPNPHPNAITPRFITTYSPSLQHLHKTLTLHWDLISQDNHLNQLFSTPQLSFRRDRALSNHIVRAVTTGDPPPPTTDIPLQISLLTPRVKPCRHPLCLTCPRLLSYNVIHCSTTKQPFHLSDSFTCNSTNLIYCIVCSKCSKMYVGQTSKTLKCRFRVHRSAARMKKSWPIYRHFSSRGHDFSSDAWILPLEHCPQQRLLTREIHWIKALNSILPHGLNSQYSIH